MMLLLLGTHEKPGETYFSPFSVLLLSRLLFEKKGATKLFLLLMYAAAHTFTEF
jgi:hypothetical protein